MDKAVDFIIVGQGLAGSALAWELLKRGKCIVVFDEPAANNASAKAAGIFNPVTGKGMTQTYLAEALFPFLTRFYGDAEKTLLRKFFFPLPLYRPFLSKEEMLQWKVAAQSKDSGKFISMVYEEPAFADVIHDSFGGILVASSGYLDVGAWTSAIREVLIQREMYHEEQFCEVEIDAGVVVRYRGYISKGIIFCNGLAAKESIWFDWLPLGPLKGETLTVEMPLSSNQIFSRGVYVVPAGKDHTFVVGSTYERAPFSTGSTVDALDSLQLRLGGMVRVPSKILHQNWGIRPTVPDRRPLIGHHPSNKNLLIFNGLGTKGVSLAPYFAHQLADWIDQRGKLQDEVNINRFKSLYSG